ncbi:hypothetical protein QJS10_CPB17g00611 [Acorus calamus]|uniref:U1-type domain-containing protein n=1 Tax=Acorus calamus TaxID=4465 RepID=A0AAV9CWC3_ACOCL|nr:hypothetical protein QJS10_CPB17g00611 [Acorus calamus]
MAGIIQRKVLPHHRILNPLSSGRIWVLWQDNLMDLIIISSSEQFVHCKASPVDGSAPFFFTAVYASNNFSDRLSLWHDLEVLALQSPSSPWIIGGDFNEIQFSNEKVGGRSIHSRHASRFNQCIEKCHLNDLRSIGGLFSWSNNQDNRIACKLDRALVNIHWTSSYSNSFIQVLSPGLSDHSPLLVTSRPPIPGGPRPFKYFQMWESHPDFSALVHDSWQKIFHGSPMFVLVKKLQHTKTVLKHWNRFVFGPVQQQLQVCRSSLEAAQYNLSMDPLNLGLISIETQAKSKYLDLVRVEESFMRQKSRQLWLSEGDRNTNFFYSMVKSRIARNSIRSVQLLDGSISSDPLTIKKHAVDYFEALLNKQCSAPVPQLPPMASLSVLDQFSDVPGLQVFEDDLSFTCSSCISEIRSSDRRLADHFGGKLHLGYMQIREKLAELESE